MLKKREQAFINTKLITRCLFKI